MSELPLLGRLAVVTGSDSGIGRAIALALAAAGADVAVSYRTKRDEAAEVAEEIGAMGRRVLFDRLDVADPESVTAYFAAVRRELGAPEILVNNAGIDGKTGDVAEIGVEDWDQVIQVNLRGPFLCIRQVLPEMIARGKGVVLNITSVHEVIPWAGHTAYCAAKAGMAMMTRSLALELQDSGVRVVALAPGAIRTPINRDVWEDPAKMADLKTKIPIGRIGETEEIAKVARMLVSDDSSYLTGVSVTVDGGMTAYANFSKGG